MSELRFLASAVTAAERRLLERRQTVRQQAGVLAAHARRRLASPVALLAAAGAGFVLGSKNGLSRVGRLFGVLQLALTALSAFKASR